MKKRLIFTVADTRYIHLVASMFYPTLRTVGRYRDDVRVVVLGSVDPALRSWLAAEGILYSADEDDTDQNMLWKFKYAERFLEEYEDVFFYDSDVWFQSDVRPLFEQIVPRKLLVCEEDTIYRRDRFADNDGFNEQSLNVLISRFPYPERESIRWGLVGRRVINAGFFGGRDLADFFEAYRRFCCGLHQYGWGFDQASINFWAYCFPGTVKRISPVFNVALSCPRGELREASPGFLTLDSVPAVAVHANNLRFDRKHEEPHFLRFAGAHPEVFDSHVLRAAPHPG